MRFPSSQRGGCYPPATNIACPLRFVAADGTASASATSLATGFPARRRNVAIHAAMLTSLLAASAAGAMFQ